ncbi:hypothetical protein AKJ42_00015 [candidate division MSBL1 archaeon SCGC-AAA261C02]|uniref:Histidine--tRNA ligase n=1 Tax=candidate division MSBL1 archaeon SCGC-AAA261C02 TaxID=1698272 RepID=A0A133V2C0_9EURY|nr:hypothetical protein AKJ42_00015 [candidate division MSBL1 archaeon SCGC-AAA261C02]
MGDRVQRPRGTRDLFNGELERVRHVERVFKSIFKRYGYQEVETPIFESLELFTKKSGSEVVNQIYEFKDKSGRELALRPELTAPVVRLYNNQLKSEPKPLKLCYFGSCFRYERKQANRWRQFSQAGVELIGSSRPESDAEMVALTNDVASQLELKDYGLRVGDIGVLRKLLIEGGIPIDNQDSILRAIDSKDESRIEGELDKSGVNEEIQEKIRELIKLKGDPNVLEEAKELLEGVKDSEKTIRDLQEILSRAQQLGVRDINIDMGIARGLEYYTGFVIELYSDDVQLGGGGRYDDLIEVLGGEPTPAVGMGFGIDRIAQLLGDQGRDIGVESLESVVLPTGDEMLDECLSIATELREKGLSIDVDLMGRKLDKALSYADSRGAKYAIIVGPEDIGEGKVTLRDMGTGNQEKVSRGKIVKELSKKI